MFVGGKRLDICYNSNAHRSQEDATKHEADKPVAQFNSISQLHQNVGFHPDNIKARFSALNWSIGAHRSTQFNDFEKTLTNQQWFGGHAPSSKDKEVCSMFRDQHITPDVNANPALFAWFSFTGKMPAAMQDAWPAHQEDNDDFIDEADEGQAQKVLSV
jgi:hypothetical protein